MNEIAPGCYGIPSIFSFNSFTCKNCAHSDGCQKESLRYLEGLETKSVNVVRLINKHRNFVNAIESGLEKEEALLRLHVRQQKRERRVKAVVELSGRQLEVIRGLPKKIGLTLKKFWEAGHSFDGHVNPFPKEGYASLRFAFGKIRTGGITKTGLREMIVDEMGWSENAAKTEISHVWKIFLALGIAREEGHKLMYCGIDPVPESDADEVLEKGMGHELETGHALSVRSDHSLAESIMCVDEIISKAKEHGYKSVALVDTMSISALAGFMDKAKKEGIKPVIGCSIRVYDDPAYRRPGKSSGEAEFPNRFFNLKAYVKEESGIRSLMRLLSRANAADYFYYHSRVGLDDVMDLEGVIISTGDINNVFHHEDCRRIVEKLSSKFETFIEFVPVKTPLFDTLNARAFKVASELGISKVVSTYPFFYGSDADADTLDVLRAISCNLKLTDPGLHIPHVRDWAFQAPENLVARVKDMAKRIGMPDELAIRSLSGLKGLVDRCAYEFRKQEPCLPKMAENEYETLVNECKKGWKERLMNHVLGYQPRQEDYPKYKQRLSGELQTLKSLGFANYFLLVQSIVRWAKDNDIKVGPGRGSVGGSLVAYLIGITDVDPIRFDLLFERFINPSRTDLPDADLDFASGKRPDVIRYIIDRFGEDRVAGISSYIALGPAGAIRDVSRVSGLSPLEYSCSKHIEKEHGVSLSLEDSAKNVPDVSGFKAMYPDIWKHATKLEGCIKNRGQHAAGVIVAGEPVMNRAIVMHRAGAKIPLVNWDKKNVEDWGLIKIDILGLSTLDVIDLALNYIKENSGNKISLLDVTLDDKKVLAAFGKGETAGIFQFESVMMKNLLVDLSVAASLTFNDLTAATALNRPGPLDAGLVDEYVAIKQGKAMPDYMHPSLEKPLKSTFGVLIYQEQIMQVCQELAGFSATDADHVRRAIGKKDSEKMSLYKVQFVDGAKRVGMDEYSASGLWDKVERFAGYAFNKSHATEYSVISYWMMWLKVYYPREFFAASMTVVDDDTKIAGLVCDARRLGIEVFPPDINVSSNRMEISDDGNLYMPFQAIKGISDTVASRILDIRLKSGGKITSIMDFEQRIKETGLNAKVNKAHREKLDRVGAFANIEEGQKPSMHPDRLRDRLDLMPGFTIDVLKAKRGIKDGRPAKMELVATIGDTRGCEKCSLKGRGHPIPRLGGRPKFMVVFDAPTWQEGLEGKMMVGDVAAYMKSAFSDSGFDFNDAYFTSLVKSPKPKAQKALFTEQINGCSGYLKREIDILKPPVILAMGPNAIRYLVPDSKGNQDELAGKVIYRTDLDASIVLGLNPMSVFFDSKRIVPLRNVFAKLKELID